jgi:hypothetical protein
MAVTKNRFSCGHKGYGKFCHRCQQAEQLEAKARELSASTGNTKKGKGKTEEDPVQTLIDEAKRLRGPQRGSRQLSLPD